MGDKEHDHEHEPHDEDDYVHTRKVEYVVPPINDPRVQEENDQKAYEGVSF